MLGAGTKVCGIGQGGCLTIAEGIKKFGDWIEKSGRNLRICDK